MPQYWLKPFGTTEPRRRVEPNGPSALTSTTS